MCENKSRTTCSRFHRLHSESNLACGGGLWGSTRSSRAAHSPLPTRCQNTPTLACGSGPHAVKRKKRTRRITLITSTIFSWICGTGPSTICFPTSARPPVLSPDACPSVADDLTSNKRHDFLQDLRHWHIHDLLHDSFRHPLLRNHLDHVNDLLPDLRHRNSENCQVHQAHLFTVTLTQGQKKKAMEWTTKNTSDGTHSNFWRIRLIVQHAGKGEKKERFRTYRMQKKRSCERRGGQDMKLDCTCAPAALDAWRLRSRRPAAAMIAYSLKEIKKPTN